MSSYVPSTSFDKEEMLKVIGLNSLGELYSHIPKEVMLNRDLNIPKGQSQLDTLAYMENIAGKNKVFGSIFRGAGAYNHYIPSVVKFISSKEEFVTAYTPYQAEVSQGLLQSIFEFQTMICQLTGLDVANASVYDGATACAEAIMMCVEKGKKKALVSETVNMDWVRVMETYCKPLGIELVLVNSKDGETDAVALESLMDETVGSVLIQQPNFYGIIEDAEKIADLAHSFSARFIMSINPIAGSVLKTPAECGADIAVGEGQPMGIPLSFGGPYIGFMSAKQDMVRRLPGRIVGETVDVKGERAYVLTMQAREQHIRREKASSSICSNQALCALTVGAYLGAMGPKGIVNAAENSIAKALYLADELSMIKGYKLKFNKLFFHEFATTAPKDYGKVLDELELNGILGGLPISIDGEACILWCATEMNSKDDIDRMVKILKEVTA
jgi:glycine dehydrogenase subunit 1